MGTKKPSDDANQTAERKRLERDRSREQGFSYVTVRVPPGSGEQIKKIAQLHRELYLDGL